MRIRAIQMHLLILSDDLVATEIERESPIIKDVLTRIAVVVNTLTIFIFRIYLKVLMKIRRVRQIANLLLPLIVLNLQFIRMTPKPLRSVKG